MYRLATLARTILACLVFVIACTLLFVLQHSGRQQPHSGSRSDKTLSGDSSWEVDDDAQPQPSPSKKKTELKAEGAAMVKSDIDNLVLNSHRKANIDTDYTNIYSVLANRSHNLLIPGSSSSLVNSDDIAWNHSAYRLSQNASNPHRFHYLLVERQLCSKQRSDLFIIAIVHSAPGNFKRRMHIRSTWGSQRYYSNLKTVVVFALGLPSGPLATATELAVVRESERFRDIIQEDFIDSYKNLTYKGIMWLRWVSESCREAKFVMKADDDIFVNIFNIVQHLHHLYRNNLGNRNTVQCLLWTRMKVQRDKKNKWYVSPSDYAGEYFTKYCSGSAYIISSDLIPTMYHLSFTTKFFWVDDFYITGLLPQMSSANYSNIASLYVLKKEDMVTKLVDGYAIFGHIGSMEARLRMWKLVLRNRGLATDDDASASIDALFQQ